MRNLINRISGQNGMTLVEILGSIVILSIILLSIVTIMNQSAKTNKVSENTLDATYVAQMEMEQLTSISTMSSPQLLDSEGYIQQADEDGWQVFHKQITDSNYFVEIKLKDAEPSEPDSTLKRIVVKVYENEDALKAKAKAQMENLLSWGESDETSP